MSYKAKRIVIAVAAAAALFAAASVGTYFYIKGNDSTQATENTEQVANQNKDSNADTPSNNPDITSNDQHNDQSTGTTNGTVANAGTHATNNNGTTTTTTRNNAEGTTTRTTTNADGTTTTIRMNNDGTTTTTVTNPDGTVTAQSTDANVITETEESERLVSKDDWVGWTPEAIPVPVVARIANDLQINKYKLNILKEVVSTDLDADGKYDLGETITYRIKVSNIGNTKIIGIKVSDKINNKEDITRMLNVDENNTLIQNIDNISEYTFNLEAGETIYFEYSYTVKEEDIIEGTITNSATAKSDKVEDTTTITTETEEVNEDYEVTKVADKKTVKAGDIVTYTITVTNTGNVTIKDIEVKDDMIGLNETVTVNVGETKTFTGTYTVTQDDIDAQKVITNTVTVGGNPTTEDITPEPENKDYTVEKTSVVTRNGVEVTDKDQNGKTIVKAGDIVTYTITVANTGNVTLKGLTLTDTMLGMTNQALPDIPVGRSTEVTGTHTISQDEINTQQEIVNTATVGNKEDTEIVVPEEQVSVSGTKTWNDDNNKYELRPDSITINLLANGSIIQSKEVKATDNWQYTFANLPKYDDNKNTISYSITEDELTDYTTQINGYNVTNTIKPVTEYTLKTNTGEIIKKPINYILVIDTSSSMNSDIDNNTHVSSRNDTNHPNSRILNAENAVKRFVQYLYTTNTTADTTQVTLISFNSSASKYKTYNKNNYTEASSLYLTTHSGTNIQDGLKVAGDNLSSSMDNVIILLSDGEPTNGTYKDDKTLGAYARTIENKQTGNYNTSIYTIAFGSDLANSGNGTKILKAISTDGTVLSSNSTSELIENLNEVEERLTPGVSHYTTSGIIEHLYSGTTALKKVSFTAKAKDSSHTDISQEYTISTIHDGNNGVFIYHATTNSNGETVYTLGIDFSQYLNDYEDFEVTYFVNSELTKTLKKLTLFTSEINSIPVWGESELEPNNTQSINTNKSDEVKLEKQNNDKAPELYEVIENNEKAEDIKEEINTETENIEEKQEEKEVSVKEEVNKTVENEKTETKQEVVENNNTIKEEASEETTE